MAKDTDQEEITKVLIERSFYNPHNVFHHEPTFSKSKHEGYEYEVMVVKWNTRSTRATILHARNDAKRGWILKTDAGIKRMAHGEKMR